jgi:Secretion system C-terminal sorting domain
MKNIQIRVLLLLLISFISVNFSVAQVSVTKDTIYITGGTFSGSENAGLMETTINNDIDANKARLNPNRVYALYEGQVYTQVSSINVNNPTGTLTIVGIPDPKHPSSTTKPIIFIVGTNGGPVGTNEVYGSIKMVNIHYQTMQMDGTQNNELFYCGTSNNLPQSLTIDNCFFEFCKIDLFDCTNESGAIGGWPYGAKFRITNSYFRNLFHNDQWWGSRVFQCKHPIDTLWVENSTFTTGGLLFLQQNELADFVYINHNTIINNKKNWMISPYRHEEYIVNNIFINQNWAGEDTNVITSGQNPIKVYSSTINIDSINTSDGVEVQNKYLLNGDPFAYTSDLALKNIKIYVSNNINYDDPELSSGYYNNSAYVDAAIGTLPSYLQWSYPGVQRVKNTPGEWMNDRTKSFFTAYSPIKGGNFVEEKTITSMPQTATSITLDVSTVTAMAQWNQNQYQDPNWPSPLSTNILWTKYIYGDYDPTTLPGLVNGKPSDNITGEAAGTQVGIRTFTDLTENFYQTANLSTIDYLPIGSLIWNDEAIKAYNSKVEFQTVSITYFEAVEGYDRTRGVKNLNSGIPAVYSLSQNYPNPFNPTTNIKYSITKESQVTLKVFDILGREVESLVNQKQAAGSYEVYFNASKLSSGIYIYRITAGDFVQSMKMILIK